MTDITAAQARAIVDAARKKAEEMGIKQNVAVVDAGANLKAFLRMDGAWLGSIDIARRRKTIALAMVGATAGILVSLYQTGVIHHLPDLPIGPFDSDKVVPTGYTEDQQHPDLLEHDRVLQSANELAAYLEEQS